jgi:hypothetical protein
MVGEAVEEGQIQIQIQIRLTCYQAMVCNPPRMPAVTSCESPIVGKTVYVSVLDENLSSEPKVCRRHYPARRGLYRES